MAEGGGCRLCLVVGAGAGVAVIDAVPPEADLACVLLRAGPAHEARRAAAALCRAVQARGAAFLVADDTGLAAAVGAEGVHLADPAGYAAARAALGPEAIVGVGCGRSRHAAMEAGEAGADYVAFTIGGDEDLELVRDWSTFTIVPCVAMGDVGAHNAAALAEAGADFIAV
ncbi:MAG: thiamine phosphate synthase, partial [Rhodospirillaceae bacterium]|nr:thiamine phosphate synthase [Rhodospirillaceae bacterium]